MPDSHLPALVVEGLIDLKAAAATFQDTEGRKPHIATLRRWATRGYRGHRLETVFVGNRLMTTRQAAGRFLSAINGVTLSVATVATSAAERAGRELDGLL